MNNLNEDDKMRSKYYLEMCASCNLYDYATKNYTFFPKLKPYSNEELYEYICPKCLDKTIYY